MELHNTIEDIVISRVDDIFNTIEKSGNAQNLCTCAQCRMDTACYVLNRTPPYYLISNRGAVRVFKDTLEHQQRLADITTLIYEGHKRVSHNQRPCFDHDAEQEEANAKSDMPVFNIPTITGRLFNGINFSPISDVTIELYFNGVLVSMKDPNWQNPLRLVPHTEGTYSFWPVPVLAKKVGEHSSFEYTIHVENEDYEILDHVFNIPAVSEIATSHNFSLGRTIKLPDIFLFPPGEDEKNRFLDDPDAH